MNPEHAASRLNAGQPRMPSFSCTRQATFGKMRSGVVVPTRTKSISLGARPALLERRERGSIREVARRLVVRRDVSLLDAGAGTDPLIGSLDHLLEIEVREDLGRQVFAGADYAGIHSCG